MQITLDSVQTIGGLAITLILGILGNGFLQVLLKRKWDKEDKKSEWQKKLEEQQESIQEVVDALLYHSLADKLEYYRVRGWADDTDRREILELHQLYKARGFNGDMDSRMENFFKLPMEEPENDFFVK